MLFRSRATSRHVNTRRPDAGRKLLEARRALATFLERRTDMNAAEAEYDRIVDDARALGAANPTRSDPFRSAEADAFGRRGDLQVARNDRLRAGTSYDEAADTLSSVVIKDDEIHAWIARLYRLAGEQRMHGSDAEGAITRFYRSVAAAHAIAAAGMAPAVEIETIVANSFIHALELRRGNRDAAAKARAEAATAIDRVVNSPAADAAQRQRVAALKARLDRQTGDQ